MELGASWHHIEHLGGQIWDKIGPKSEPGGPFLLGEWLLETIPPRGMVPQVHFWSDFVPNQSPMDASRVQGGLPYFLNMLVHYCLCAWVRATRITSDFFYMVAHWKETSPARACRLCKKNPSVVQTCRKCMEPGRSRSGWGRDKTQNETILSNSSLPMLLLG